MDQIRLDSRSHDSYAHSPVSLERGWSPIWVSRFLPSVFLLAIQFAHNISQLKSFSGFFCEVTYSWGVTLSSRKVPQLLGEKLPWQKSQFTDVLREVAHENAPASLLHHTDYSASSPPFTNECLCVIHTEQSSWSDLQKNHFGLLCLCSCIYWSPVKCKLCSTEHTLTPQKCTLIRVIAEKQTRR